MAAGLGFKDFTTGEVLTAADVDGYLMQGIWVFASATARDAAVTSPQEGNFAYLKDTNTTTYYTGSAWTNLDTTGMVNPMTTTGDTIYSSSGSTPARLGIGSTGQVLTVAGGVPTWATPASGSTFVGVRLTKSGTQSLTNNTGTKITWDTETYDTDAFHSTSSNTSRITIPSGKAGYYSITATGAIAGNTTGQRYFAFYKNGTMVLVFGRAAGYSADTALSGTAIFNLAESDYIELEAFQSSGGALDFQDTILTQFSAQFLGA